MFLTPSAAESRFDGGVPIQERLFDFPRRCRRPLPGQRRGRDATFDMAGFALAAFAPFFMGWPSFLAHQNHLETGQGRSNRQILFLIRNISGGGQISGAVSRSWCGTSSPRTLCQASFDSRATSA
jgi:hypothetical protein